MRDNLSISQRIQLLKTSCTWKKPLEASYTLKGKMSQNLLRLGGQRETGLFHLAGLNLIFPGINKKKFIDVKISL